MKTKDSYLGTLEEREEAYKKLKRKHPQIPMQEGRLDDLYQRGIYESEEIDSILDRLHPMYEDLKWQVGLND